MGSKAKELAKLLSGSGQGGTIAPALVSDQNNTSTGFFDVPAGTTEQRPDPAQTGYIRFNSTIGLAEYYDGSSWKPVDTPPLITSIDYQGAFLAADPAGGETVVLNGSNFATAGTVAVRIDGVDVPSVTVNSSSQITITTPAKPAGNYGISVANPSGLSSDSVISYSINPSWNTAENTVLVSQTGGSSVNITSLSASEGSDNIQYSEITSVLGNIGLAVNTNTCAITGTLPNPDGSTVYTFTLRATDEENQFSDRQFKIEVTANFFGDGSDGVGSF